MKTTKKVKYKEVEIGGTFFSQGEIGSTIEQYKKQDEEVAYGIFSGKWYFESNEIVTIEVDANI